MKQYTTTRQHIVYIPEVQNTIQEGYTNHFEFVDGAIHSVVNGQLVCSILESQIRPVPCMKSEITIYRIITPDGTKGFVVLEWQSLDTPNE